MPLPDTDNNDAIFQADRRLSERVRTERPVWIVDHSGKTVLPCQCVDMSEDGMRLRVPLGYGIGPGQRYELHAQKPNGAPSNEVSVGFDNRLVTIVRTRICLGDHREYLEVGVVFDGAD